MLKREQETADVLFSHSIRLHLSTFCTTADRASYMTAGLGSLQDLVSLH